jgi:hypothetical protein
VTGQGQAELPGRAYQGSFSRKPPAFSWHPGSKGDETGAVAHFGWTGPNQDQRQQRLDEEEGQMNLPSHQWVCGGL